MKTSAGNRGYTLIERLACQPKPWRRQVRAGFTLIELLVVITIIGVLFAVALPVFENAGKKDTDRAAQSLVGTMRLARQHAINKRQWVIVVFPNLDGGNYTDTGGNDLAKCLRSYTALAVTGVTVSGVASIEELERPDQIPDNMQFSFISDWKYLPEGIYFDNDDTLTGNYIFKEKSTTFLYPVNPATPNARVRPMCAVLFKPNGRAFKMAGGNANGKFWQDVDYSKIYLTSAKFYQNTKNMLEPDPPPIPGGTNTVLEIRNKTGQVSIWQREGSL